jgi:hypothetical protein
MPLSVRFSDGFFGQICMDYEHRRDRIGARHDPYSPCPPVGSTRRPNGPRHTSRVLSDRGKPIDSNKRVNSPARPLRRDRIGARHDPYSPCPKAGGGYAVTRCVRVCSHLSDRGQPCPYEDHASPVLTKITRFWANLLELVGQALSLRFMCGWGTPLCSSLLSLCQTDAIVRQTVLCAELERAIHC